MQPPPAPARRGTGKIDPPAPPSRTVFSVETQEPVVALTFDDGPDPVFTAPKLDILASFGARATFFYLGLFMALLPRLTRETVRRGHEIGNHSFDHPDLTRVRPWEVFRQIGTTRSIQVRITGSFWPFFRPPFGFLDDTVLAAAGRLLSPFTVLWNVDPRDWELPGQDEITKRVLAAVRPGAIVLLHDWVAQTVKALPSILQGLVHQGLRPVSVHELLALGGLVPAPPQCRRLALRRPLVRGADVGAAQTRLTALGLDPGPVDEVYGPRTAEAVLRFQQVAGLPSTGVVDRDTYRALGVLCPRPAAFRGRLMGSLAWRA